MGTMLARGYAGFTESAIPRHPTQFQARTLPSQVDGEQEVNSVQDAVAAGS